MFSKILFPIAVCLIVGSSGIPISKRNSSGDDPLVFQPVLNKKGDILWDFQDGSRPDENRQWVFANPERKRIVFFQVPPPPQPFIGRINERAFLRYKHIDTKYIVVTGPEGIGKSSLAAQYAIDYVNQTNGSVVWINAFTYSDMTNSFERLAAELNLPRSNMIVSLFRTICEYFMNQSVLFIFDDAKSDNELLRNLIIYTKQNKNILVLITSRYTNWSPVIFFSMPLIPFTNEEAAKYLKKIKEPDNFLSLPNTYYNIPRLDSNYLNYPMLQKVSRRPLPLHVQKLDEMIEEKIKKGKEMESSFTKFTWTNVGDKP